MDATTIEGKTSSGPYAAVRRTYAMVYHVFGNILSFSLSFWSPSL